MTTPSVSAPPGVIDAHVHVFPPEFVDGREHFLARDQWFELLYTNPRALLVSAETLVQTMAKSGVEHAVVCGFPWSDVALCREHNAYMADAVARYPDRLSWLGIVVPGSIDAEVDTRWSFEHGAVGIGELNADAQRFDWRETRLLEGIVNLCRAAVKPILLHASEPVGHAYPGKGSATPEKLLTFFEAFPDLQVIAGHWGGGLPIFELMPEVAVATANVVYDCAASTYLYKARIFRTVLDIVGRERVLFGSDYPVLRMDRFLERVLQLGWTDDAERDAVLGGNARRVFGIGPTRNDRQ